MLGLLLALQVAAPHDALRYDVTLVPSDTGTHLLGEVETTWRLASSEPVIVRLDSSMRVVRVLIDGRPNTRISRTMYARSSEDVLVPHQKPAGDSITTRIRYHGLARGLTGVGGALVGSRGGRPIFFASAGGEGAPRWLPVAEGAELDRVVSTFRIQLPAGHRAIAPGELVGVDTLPYGHVIRRYQLDVPVPVTALAVASGPYQVTEFTDGCGPGCLEGTQVWRYPGARSPDPGIGGVRRIAGTLAALAGPYPFEGMVVHVEAPVAELFAAPGVVFHPEGSLDPGRETPAAEAVVLGTAKQWFGVAVAARQEDRWITDGLARYLERLWPDRAGRLLEGAPSAAESRELRDARTFHRLRKAVGDSAFFRGLARVVDTHRARPLTPESFLETMSEAAGRKLELSPAGR
ncbi:MAG TPA: hypothetical protein VG500_03820 [Gemmatimonadales bacterium]|nr:hypothetical protein [Gemmatimonadales bacterium]